MNIPGLLVVATGIIFMIYSVIYKNKISINISDKLVLIDREKFLNLQLYFSIFNSVCMIVFGILIIKYNLHNIYVLIYGFIFIFINYMLIPISIKKEYIKHK
ncbi:hypothetical protein [Clostridium intestinale]|uniref:hypothetical protein n=1 Tax=Clostridium intestinale TaxID=36845 RepID=UPI0028E3997C|nr:hypothetical protein [Clostridium intestinale]